MINHYNFYHRFYGKKFIKKKVVIYYEKFETKRIKI